MPSINFVPGTVIPSVWLNEVDNGIFNILPTVPSTMGFNMSGSINQARVTLAATATTTPLWLITQGAIQDWTGTPTITDFPAADQAGSYRWVFPDAGTVITHGGSITVRGNVNYTVSAGDALIVQAVTTTTFLVDIIKQSGYPAGPNFVRSDVNQQFTVAQRTQPLVTTSLSFDLTAKQDFISTPAGAGTLTFTNLSAGQKGEVTLINTGNFAIAKIAAVKCPTTMLASISATGTYRLAYSCPDGINVYVTSSAALA